MSKQTAKQIIEDKLKGTIYQSYGGLMEALWLGADEGGEFNLELLCEVIEELLK